MHVVLRGITIWTLYTLVSRVSVACLSTTNRVKLELVYDPMPVKLFEPYQYRRGPVIKRLYRKKSTDMSAVATECNCTESRDSTELGRNDFPSYVAEVQCRNRPWCKKVVYPINVLTKQKPGAGQTCSQDLVPKALVDENWCSYVKIVTVACSCFYGT